MVILAQPLLPALLPAADTADQRFAQPAATTAEYPARLLRQLAAALIRSIRRGAILEPIMVHAAHQRRGLATALLSASLAALSHCGTSTLYSRRHLGNAASLAWHERNGFEEIPNYFAASHRWRHFAWLAEHFEDAGQPDRASQMRELAQHWKTIVQQFDESQPWSSGLLS